MAAFSAHQLYRSQLTTLASKARNTRLVEGLLSQIGKHVELQYLDGTLRAGARPYAQLRFAAVAPPNALFVLGAYAANAHVSDHDKSMLLIQHDGALGVIALHQVLRDVRVPGVRVLARLPVARIARYSPGRRLLVRLHTTSRARAMLDLRSAEQIRGLSEDTHALAQLFDVHAALAPRVHSRLCGISYRQPPGTALPRALRCANAPAAMLALACAHARLHKSALDASRAENADAVCWNSIAVLQQLMRAQPGIAELATTLIGLLTAAHARHPGDVPVTSTALQGLHGWSFDGQRAQLNAPVRLVAQEPERVAASVRETLIQTVPAQADTLFERYCDAYAQRAAALRPRVIRLYRAHARIARALYASQRLDPHGDQAARNGLLEAKRLAT